MKVHELIRLLEKNGWVHLRTRGDHRQFAHDRHPSIITVAGNLGRDVPTGTLHAILKVAGLKED